MSFNYSKLRGRIKEKFETQERFAQKMGMSRTTLSQKLNNLNEFTQQEINNATELLELSLEDISVYFFNVDVQKTEQIS